MLNKERFATAGECLSAWLAESDARGIDPMDTNFVFVQWLFSEAELPNAIPAVRDEKKVQAQK